MKRNIDLTEHGDFNMKNREDEFNHIFSLFRTNKRIPWNTIELTQIDCEEDLARENNQMFPVGTVKTIKLTKEVTKFCTGAVCDCCGKSLRFNLFQETLCKNCSEDLKESYGIPIPWRRLQSGIESDDFLVRYLNAGSEVNDISWE